MYHSGDWRFALPIASCGLTLDDEAVRVAVSLRHGLDLCEPHQSQCGSAGTPMGYIVLSVREPRAGQQGTMLWTTWSLDLLPQLECPSQKSLPGCPGWTGNDRTALHSSLGRARSRCTVICPLAESYVSGAAREAGAAAEVAATRKEKYAQLDSRYLFEPIVAETLGVFNTSANSLLKETGLKISLNTGESRETSFLYQRISVLV